MDVRIRLFAALRERAGTAELALELPAGSRVADALDAVSDLAGGLPLVMAVNREYAGADRVLEPGDELALVPPVSGGEARVRVRVTDEPLRVDPLLDAVRDPRAGAVVTFSGVTRDVDALDYEGYAEMAEAELRRIAEAAVRRHGLCAAAVEHRVGTVALGEASVVVAASAAHRAEAFAGARELIDEIKVRAPIWKREEGAWKHEATPPAPA